MPRHKVDVVHLRGKHGKYRFAFGAYEHKLELGIGGTWMLLRSLRNPTDESDYGIESAEFTSRAEAVNFAIEEARPRL